MAWPYMLGSAALTAIPTLLEKFFPGKKHSYEQVPTMTGGQRGLLDQMMASLGGQGQMGGPMGQGMNYLSQMISGSPEDMQAFERPAMRQFNEQIVPGLAERFSSLGSGSQGSSAFGQALGGAGAGLAERLQMIRSHLQSNAMDQLSRLFGYGMEAKPFATAVQPGQGGWGAAVQPGMSQLGGQMGLLGMMRALNGISGSTNQFNPKTDTMGPYGSYMQGQYNPYSGMTS